MMNKSLLENSTTNVLECMQNLPQKYGLKEFFNSYGSKIFLNSSRHIGSKPSND